MKRHPIHRLLLAGLAAVFAATLAAATPAFSGHWRLDTTRSSALDGWHKMDLTIGLDGSEVSIGYIMQWRSTIEKATNVFDTSSPVEMEDFFRVEQRHMSVYAAEDGETRATAEWIDDGHTLRTEVITPVEVSQGVVDMRITTEYRLSESGDRLTVIELHSSRNRPLIYVFNRVKEEK